MMIATKIICTIGPKISSYNQIIELIVNGMNVARINFSHGDKKYHLNTINNLKRARTALNKPLAIMLDTKGPEIRVVKVLNDSLDLKKGSIIKLVSYFSGKEDEVQITPFSVTECLEPEMKVLFDDGYIICSMVGKRRGEFFLEVKNDGILKSGKKVSIPEGDLNLPAMTEQDVEDIKFGCLHDIDIIAASFIRSPEQVLEIKKLLFEEKKSEIMVIAKIENKKGLENFEAILELADGIMVARGDLGVEIPLSQVPKYQKMMIKKCYQSFKPVVTATQMLESMIKNPRPTRAEASDVANAIYDSTSSVMLSGETAVGEYPVETLIQMTDIIKETEEDFDNEHFFEELSSRKTNSVSSAVAIAAVKTAYSSNAKAIFIHTSSGSTAELISSMRPKIPIIALTSNKKTYNQLSFLWGVIPLFVKECRSAGRAFTIMSDYAIKNNLAEFGDLIVVTAGVPFGRKGSTNLMMLDSIGHVIVRGKGYGTAAQGKIKIIQIVNSTHPSHQRGKIIVMLRCEESYLPFLKYAKGIILQNSVEDTDSEKKAIAIAKKLKIPIIVRAENAITLLKDEELVTLDATRGLVYFPPLCD
jgi:pyruvate kinase